MNKKYKMDNIAGYLAKIKNMELNGMYTVEMSYIAPFILSVFFLSIMGIFYYHDKAIAVSAAYETAAIASTKAREKEAVSETLASSIFEERIRGKCIVFGNPTVNAKVDKERITVTGDAKKGRMSLAVEASSCITEPEEKIRNYRKIGLKRPW